MNTPTVREFINIKDKEGVGFKSRELEEAFIEFAKLHVKAALEEASIKAELDLTSDYKGCEINISSIINAYPLNLIK